MKQSGMNPIRFGGLSTLNAAYVNQDSWRRASAGMRIQDLSSVKPGAVMFRFYEKATASARQCMTNPWWFQGKEVRKMLQNARRLDKPAPEVVRSNAALSPEWDGSGANFIISVRVRSPVTVFWGDPKPVGWVMTEKQQNGGNVIVPAHTGFDSGSDLVKDEMPIVPDPRCTQFYVPGAWESRLTEKMFETVAQLSLADNKQLDAGDIESFLRSARGE